MIEPVYYPTPWGSHPVNLSGQVGYVWTGSHFGTYFCGMNISVIVTGATGMVGEGVLHQCLNDTRVDRVLSVSRKPTGIVHPNLRELLVPDFFDLSAVADQLSGYTACFFCLGVSSIGMTEPDYYRLTHTLTMNMARLLSQQNPDMTFCYVSGAGTDSTEKGKQMWARVKGKTENDLMTLPFKRVYAFRPAFIQPTPGLKNVKSYYQYLSWLFPILGKLAPSYVGTLTELAQAMLNVTTGSPQQKVLEVPDIRRLAAR